MESIGNVVKIEGDIAVVEVMRTSACEGCHKSAEGGCSVCTLMGGDRNRAVQTRAGNPLSAEVGDRVKIESPAGRVLLWAGAVFILPLIMVAVGFGIAVAFTDEILWRTAGAVAGFVLSFIGLRILSGILKNRTPDASITEIIQKANQAVN